MEHNIPKMTVSPHVQKAGNRFAKLASKFCKLVDSHTKIPVIEFMIRMERLLARTYLEASELPIVDLPSELIDLRLNESFSNSKPSKPSDSSKFHERMQQLSTYLGEYDRYWHVCDPIDDADNESIVYFISGDLSEIYDDLNNRLDNWQNGNPTQKNETVSEWQQHWDIHWGDHALNALRAIHSRIYDYIRDTDCDELELKNKK